MPRSTIRHPFEHRVFDWANAMSGWIAPGRPRTFLLVLDATGAVTGLLLGLAPPGWHERVEALSREGTPHFFFDPFDFPEYAWVSWSGVRRATMERLMRAKFAETDFAGTEEFPETWSFMY